MEGRKVIFEGGDYEDARSLIFKNEISDGILEVFVMLIMIVLFLFISNSGRY
jgi:hypothetical protein